MKSFDARLFDSLLESETDPATAFLCPEIRLRLAPDLPTLWRAQERCLGRVGLAPPYWGIAWPGGQALARFILDNPAIVRGRRVLDLGSGSGICAIAAAMAGAVVCAADTDRGACSAIAANAASNAVDVSVTPEDPLDGASRWEVILAADLWYERFMARRVTSWLRNAGEEQTRVLLGDPGRAYFPREGPVEVGRYLIRDAGAAERDAETVAYAWRWVNRG